MELGKICIVEDDVATRDLLRDYFSERNFTVYHFGSVEELEESLDKNFEGLFLLDWNLPGQSGLDLVKKIRQRDKISKIFIISALYGKSNVMEGLQAGADDYLTKPFSVEELALKVSTAQQRLDVIDNEIRIGLKLLPEKSAIEKDGNIIHLTNREYIIFEKLRNQYKKPTTRTELIACFNQEEKMSDRNIDVHVVSLRKKVKEIGLSINTVWGKGYQLD